MDDQKAELTANVIAQNMYAQCDSKGNQYLLLAGIVGDRKGNSAVEKKDMHIRHGSNSQVRITTKGWSLCVEWKDGSTSWERLASLKESNPVEVADYAIAHAIDNKPAFAWWVPFTLRQRDRIIAAVNLNDISSERTSLGSRYPSHMMTAFALTRKMAVRFARMPFGRRWQR